MLASVFEVGWVVGLKHSHDAWQWALTIVAMVISFWALIYTSKFLPTSTVYAVFVGLGTAGTVLMEMVLFGEPFNATKVFFIALLLFGVIGLKLATNVQTEGGSE